MPTIAQCFSTLIASGNGQSCNKILDKIHSELGPDEVVLFKNNSDKRIMEVVANIINPYVINVDSLYWGEDLKE